MSYNYTKSRLVFGVGVNDVNFSVTSTVDGKQFMVKSYSSWHGMLQRCYCSIYHTKKQTYIGCSVCDEWLYFSNFRDWYDVQYKEPRWHLDKDILQPGNKVYSPDTCVFVPPLVNSFINSNNASRGECMIGVSWYRRHKKYMARCNNPFNGKVEHLGYFTDELEAHLAWKKRKHELACQLADTVHDSRLTEALRLRYKGDFT